MCSRLPCRFTGLQSRRGLCPGASWPARSRENAVVSGRCRWSGGEQRGRPGKLFACPRFLGKMMGRASLGAVLVRAVVRLGVERARRAAARRARARARPLFEADRARAGSLCRQQSRRAAAADERSLAPSAQRWAARAQCSGRSERGARSHAVCGRNAGARARAAELTGAGACRFSLRARRHARARS